MKNNLRFIFPRLIGATLIVGLASFIMITLFKLLVGAIIIGGLVALIRRISPRHRYDLGSRYAAYSNGGIGPMSHNNQWATPITVDANPLRKETIIPIN